ncbi:unnamed protein product [Durusdinium trenchii]|uniref:Carbamoyltransferase n=1 Tax=Durusdinium trenchii TaxID=1381693 RepID=A0ABP0MET9_9DINO
MGFWHVILAVASAAWSIEEVEISVDAGEIQLPLTWRPALDDVSKLTRAFLRANGLDTSRLNAIVRDLKVKRAWDVVFGSSFNHSVPTSSSTSYLHLSGSQMPLRGAMVTRAVKPSEGAVLALHMGHDASMAVSYRGRVQCVLELERLFGQRYYRPPLSDPAQFQASWNLAFEKVQTRCVFEDGWPLRFEHAVLVAPPVHETEQAMLIMAAEQFFSIEKWHLVDHHEAHALSAFHSSPFRSALIVSYDSAGNDGHFNVYVGSFDKLERIAQLDYSLGHAYNALASLLPEVTGRPIDEFFACDMNFSDELLASKELYFEKNPFATLSWAGKLMGYAAVAAPREDLRHSVRFFIEASNAWIGVGSYAQKYPPALVKAACESAESQRELAATIQSEFEAFVHARVGALLQHIGHGQVEGLVLTGGCALNVLANQRIYDTFTADTAAPLGFYVPPVPNDSGLSLGALWSIAPPRVRQPLQYLGFPLWDEALVLRHARQRGAQRLSKLGGIEYLAELLAGGEVWRRQRNHTADKPIVAVVRGRQEFGPRALGHRSLLAVPDGDMKKRMNRLKARQWYRPVAPMIAEEALNQVFGRDVRSPFMTMAPRVRPEIQKSFPSLVHLDGTARHQSVSQFDEAWIHALLLAVGRHTGLAALINTSFNTKGKPIVNTVKESLRMLDELPDLDFLIVEDWLFRKRRFLEKRNVADAAASGTSK